MSFLRNTTHTSSGHYPADISGLLLCGNHLWLTNKRQDGCQSMSTCCRVIRKGAELAYHVTELVSTHANETNLRMTSFAEPLTSRLSRALENIVRSEAAVFAGIQYIDS